MAILRWIRNRLTGGPYYVRISRNRLNVLNSKNGARFLDEPLIAIDLGAQRVVQGVGSSARSCSGKIVNPFSHPRLLVTEFEVFEKLLKHAFSVVSATKFISPAPVVVMHVIEELEGGLTDIEKRFLHEGALGAGAFDVYFWSGPELTHQQLQEGTFRREAIE